MTNQVKCFDFQAMSSQERQGALQAHRIALTESEALKIQVLLKRPPTLAECILWGIQGSEHCSYKSTRQYLKTLCTEGPNVILGAKEDAGIVWVCEDKHKRRYCIAISHESHNHPSQVVPFEGAATGIGGNVRDVSCMGAELIANADSLRFGDATLHQSQWISDAVVKGIASYGNAIGVPNIAGDAYHHASFNDNCLVTAVSLGVVREDHIIHSYAPKNGAGYDLVLIGKPTDNSGFGGASFASVDLDDEDTENNRSAVQEPNAFLGRMLLKANHALFQKLQEKGLTQKVGFKDLGAGGIACASIELAECGGYGAEVFLDQVPVSQKNLDPSVILCAETQERYMWVVPPELTSMILEHYNEIWQLPQISSGAKATPIGKICSDDQYIVHYKNQCLISAKASDITKGIVYDRPVKTPVYDLNEPQKTDETFAVQWERISQHAMLTSQEPVYEQYDKQVQGRTVLERGYADAGVLQPFNSSEYPDEIQQTGIALGLSANLFYGQINSYWTAFHAVLNSICKVMAVGAIPWALTDCLCFGNPEQPEQMWELARATAGLKAASEGFGLIGYEQTPLPIVAGNVSLYNQNKNGKAIPASPMVSCLGKINDVACVLTPILKSNDSVLICLGERTNELGGSIYYDTLGALGSNIPQLDIDDFRLLAEQFLQLRQAGLISSAKTIEYGGLLTAVQLMCHDCDFGAELSAETALSSEAFWFGEMPGWVIEVKQLDYTKVSSQLNNANVPWVKIGKTNNDGSITLALDHETICIKGARR